MTPDKMYQENREIIKALKSKWGLNNTNILFNHKDKGIVGIYKDGKEIEHSKINSNLLNYIKYIKNEPEIQVVLDMIYNKDYTKTIATYSNELRKNVIPIQISYHRDNVLSDRWDGYFINLDNGSIYHIESGRQRYSKYKYEFHTIYLDGPIFKHLYTTELL